jgi:hypothetical protein
MDEAERQHIATLIENHTRRLRELEKQAATWGLSTPPETTTEMEDIRRSISDLKKQLVTSRSNISPLKLPTTPITEEAQAVINAAKAWGTTLHGWLSKLSLLDSQDRLAVLYELTKSQQEKQATSYLFAALSSELPQEEIATIVNKMIRRVVLSEDFDYKANFMSTIPVDVLQLASISLINSLFRDAIDIMNRDQFKEVNKVTPAVIKIQGAIPEALIGEYVEAILSQAISGANTGRPAARKAALALPDEWATLGLQTFDKKELILRATSSTQDEFYKEFLQRYTALWPDEKRELYQDYLTLSNRKMVEKYYSYDDEDE